MRIYKVAVILISLMIVSCATKFERYSIDISTTYNPSTLLSITNDILTDDSLEESAQRELLYRVIDRTLTLMKSYSKFSNNDNVKERRKEIDAGIAIIEIIMEYAKSIDMKIEGVPFLELMNILK